MYCSFMLLLPVLTIIVVWVVGDILTYSAGILVHLFWAYIVPKCIYGI